MADAALPASLLDRLREMESRLAALERSPRLPSSAIQGGKLTLLDDAGDPVAYIGQHEGPGGDQEVGVRFVNGKVGMSAEEGLYAPAIQVEPRSLNVATNVTGGSFASVYQFAPRFIQANAVRVEFVVATDVGTTGEVRLESVRGGDNATSYTDVQAVPSGTSVTYYSFDWDLSAVTNPISVGSTAFVNLQARRTSGAGAFWVYLPVPMFFAHPARFGATASGL